MNPNGPVRARRAAPLVLCLVGAACAAAPAPAPAPAAAPAPGATAAAITPADLRLRVFTLADDSMRGRETGRPGARMAADYLVAEARRLGLRPAGDGGTYLHRVPLTRRSSAVEARTRTAAGEVELTRDDVLLLSGLAGLPPSPRPQGEAPIVYAGYVVDPTIEQELTPAQLAGAAVILRLEAAPGADETAGPRFPVGALLGPGSPAAAVLLVAEGETANFWDYARGQAEPLGLSGGEEQQGGGPPVFLISPEATARLLGTPLDQARQPRTGVGTLSWRIRETKSEVDAWNVVAVLPGSDRARAGQYVALGSHYDHEGVGEPVDGDSIYNGADDDASGVSAMLEIAERYASLPRAERPARSLLFVWHTAEEEGLIGSDWFTRNPTVPRDSIVAQLNIDMIGRNHPDSVFVVGARRLSTELGAMVEAVNARQPEPMVLDYTFDAPGHPEQIYCRSDHYSYARFGIPVAFFTTGLHPDYHKPSDEPEKVDYEKLARVTRLIAELTGAIAAAPARPTVDQPVPPFGAPCTQ